ncbi:Cys-tRNA(Pro) deacylase [Suttonella indologenes]|uniref:Cys-tRNA(Pro)/Cys-tRNA(Cys) deacylase n=1 Tax=Suttonella indologenes TaxID=13276 RepID=A0A380MZS5_9GAMM|nr:Cys-tRNA(Pro) deacylase [Suttonella indologenes]SUO97724.1 Cys-tRNA(Pro)/Cys-tRNA(Cys) deacylase ybaK [Suttonella indologenes]
MSKKSYPITPAVRFLREHQIAYEAHLYDYEEHGGTARCAQELHVDEHCVIKTIILQDDKKQGLIMLMHGDKEISTRQLARIIGARHIEPASPAQANKWSGYLVGGTSPFACKSALPVYVESSILDLDTIYINGGKRGFLVAIAAKDLQVLQPQAVEAVA